MLNLLSALLLLASAPPAPSSGSKEPPSDEAVLRAVFPAYAPGEGVGGQFAFCNESGPRDARLLDLKPWQALGGDVWVAVFALGFLGADAMPATTAEGRRTSFGWAQACGPRPEGVVALLARVGENLRLVAKAEGVEADTLDLAPYRVQPDVVLIGARAHWMNHGFGYSKLTLLRVNGASLDPVLTVAVDTFTAAGNCTGIVSMAPRGTAPADLQVTWTEFKYNERLEKQRVGQERSTFEWRSPGRYVERSSKDRRCVWP